MAILVAGAVALQPSAVSAETGSVVAREAPRYADALEAADSVLGDRYRWGGAAPGGFDCSGLVRWSFAKADKDLPHSSRAQRSATLAITEDQAVSGDLVFFGSPVHHVGIYRGDGLMIHSPRSGDVVKITSVHDMGSTPQFGRVK